MEELEESVWIVVRQENEREFQGEGVHDSGKTGTGIRCTDMSIQEDTGKNKFEVAEMRMLRWMCGVTKLDKIGNYGRTRWTMKVGEITNKVQPCRKGGLSGMGM